MLYKVQQFFPESIDDVENTEANVDQNDDETSGPNDIEAQVNNTLHNI
jgi:hypothetical protein